MNSDEYKPALDILNNKGVGILIVRLHHGYGRWLRNNWGLWSKEGSLYEHFTDMGIGHADDMSSILLTTACRRILGDDDQLQEQVDSYKKFWRNQDIDPLTLEPINENN